MTCWEPGGDVRCPARPESVRGSGVGWGLVRGGDPWLLLPGAIIPQVPVSIQTEAGSPGQETQSLWSPWAGMGAQEGSGFCLLKGDPTATPGAVGLPRPEATLPLLFVGLEAAAHVFFFSNRSTLCSSAHGSQEKQAAARLGNLPPAAAGLLARAQAHQAGDGPARGLAPN